MEIEWVMVHGNNIKFKFNRKEYEFKRQHRKIDVSDETFLMHLNNTEALLDLVQQDEVMLIRLDRGETWFTGHMYSDDDPLLPRPLIVHIFRNGNRMYVDGDEFTPFSRRKGYHLKKQNLDEMLLYYKQRNYVIVSPINNQYKRLRRLIRDLF